MGSNLTPTGLTPTYFSPPAFFMNSFTQNMLSFQKYLNNPDGQENNSWALLWSFTILIFLSFLIDYFYHFMD